MTLNVALLFGGRSPEHEVSIRSANTIYGALRQTGAKVHCIGIDREGVWHYQQVTEDFPASVDTGAPEVTLKLGRPVLVYTPEGSDTETELRPDVLFPALHGPWGEDGTIQGLAAMCDLPCAGSATLGSAIAMDKDVTKRLLRDAGIPVAPWLSCRDAMPAWQDVTAALGNVVFVKPAASGSSVGVRRVTDAKAYAEAFDEARKYGAKVLLETEIRGREIECAILETTEGLKASIPGEIIPTGGHCFYDYDAKYTDDDGAQLIVPADLPATVVERVQDLARQSFICLELRTLARIDFFVTTQDEVILNEVNTLPGFTSISMYPRMFAATGYPLDKLVAAILEHTLVAG